MIFIGHYIFHEHTVTMKSPNLRMCTTSCFLLVIILSSLSLQARGSQEANRSTATVNVVIVGGTGDLAKKYLWQGFFNLYQGTNVNMERFVVRVGVVLKRTAGFNSNVSISRPPML